MVITSRRATPTAMLLDRHSIISANFKVTELLPMPVRSSTSRVLKWPKPDEVITGLKRWAAQTVPAHPELLRIGYFGSYARGNWGVGSDLDVVLVVRKSDRPFMERAAEWDLLALPVPTDLLVYTMDEWEQGMKSRKMFKDIVWIYTLEPTGQRFS